MSNGGPSHIAARSSKRDAGRPVRHGNRATLQTPSAPTAGEQIGGDEHDDDDDDPSDDTDTKKSFVSLLPRCCQQQSNHVDLLSPQFLRVVTRREYA
jgi:hypothetical protein